MGCSIIIVDFSVGCSIIIVNFLGYLKFPRKITDYLQLSTVDSRYLEFQGTL